MIDMLSAVLGSFPPISQTTHEDGADVMTVERGNMAVIRGCQHVPYSRPPADIEYLLNGSRIASSRQYISDGRFHLLISTRIDPVPVCEPLCHYAPLRLRTPWRFTSPV